jgi:hypothetical protein
MGLTTPLPGRGHRPAVLADLVRTFEAHFAEHRECDGLAGSIVEVIENGVPWGVAWMACAGCGVRWERRRTFDLESSRS